MATMLAVLWCTGLRRHRALVVEQGDGEGYYKRKGIGDPSTLLLDGSSAARSPRGNRRYDEVSDGGAAYWYARKEEGLDVMVGHARAVSYGYIDVAI
jgi:hypothetical protein